MSAQNDRQQQQSLLAAPVICEQSFDRLRETGILLRQISDDFLRLVAPNYQQEQHDDVSSTESLSSNDSIVESEEKPSRCQRTTTTTTTLDEAAAAGAGSGRLFGISARFLTIFS